MVNVNIFLYLNIYGWIVRRNEKAQVQCPASRFYLGHVEGQYDVWHKKHKTFFSVAWIQEGGSGLLWSFRA